VARWTGVTITKNHALDIVQAAVQDFAQFYAVQCRRERREAAPLPLLILTADGKGVLVRTQDLRPATRKRAAQRAAKKGAESNETTRWHARRMATVASVYEIDRFVRTPEEIVESFFPTQEPSSSRRRRPPVPKAKRLWASLKHPPETIVRDLFEDAMRRDPAQQKEWVVLVDGDPHQIARFRRLAKASRVRLTLICDIVHVLGYLWKAAAVLQEDDQVATWVRRETASDTPGEKLCCRCWHAAFSDLSSPDLDDSGTGRRLRALFAQPCALPYLSGVSQAGLSYCNRDH